MNVDICDLTAQLSLSDFEHKNEVVEHEVIPRTLTSSELHEAKLRDTNSLLMMYCSMQTSI